MKTLLWILPLALLLACDPLKIKSEVMGTATNLSDGSPLTGYKVHLVESTTPLDLGSPITSTVIATTEVSSSGQFAFEAELKRDSRLDYAVVFDPGADLFGPNGYKTRSGLQADMNVTVEKEKGAQFVAIYAIPSGYIHYSLTNNTSEPGYFEVYMKNNIFYGRDLNLDIQSGEMIVSNGISQASSGISEIIVKRSIDGQFVDSAVFEWFIPQNDTTLVELIINEP